MRRVLVIEDHPHVRDVAREVLERRSFEVVGEADGATSGLRMATRTRPDAVLLDIRLPDGDGIDVCRALTQADPGLVVLLLSADELLLRGVDISECGAVGVLPKSRLASADLASLLRGR